MPRPSTPRTGRPVAEGAVFLEVAVKSLVFGRLLPPSLLFVAAGSLAFGCAAAPDKGGTVFLDGGTDAASEGGFEPDTGGGFGLDGAPEAALDPEKDNDGDGYLFKDDCNDGNPEINPGAYEFPGDGVDNDCDGKIDNAEPDCDTAALKYDSKDATDFARALGICRAAKADATGKDKGWGLVSAKLVRADGKSALDSIQYGILKKFGTYVNPRQGKNFAVLSSGTARTPDYPGFITPIMPSYESLSEVTPPAGWPKNSAGCPEPFDKTANDSASLELEIRVPTNAKGFAFDFNFYSSEYITFVCSEFNDSFVALLDTKAAIDPKYSKNVSFDSKGNPINVNSGFFEVCTPGSKGGKTFPCAKGTKELEGTGFQDSFEPTENGATSWLETKAPVVPGETIKLRFIVWDTGDHILDSTVLVDNFRWDVKGTVGPVTDRPK